MSHKDDEQHNVSLRRQNHERGNEIDVKITYFNKRERQKRVRFGYHLSYITCGSHFDDNFSFQSHLV